MRKSDKVKKPDFVDNHNLRFIGKGIECQVFEIVKLKLVCKAYDTHADAKYNYVLQRIAYRAGIGPEPMGLEKNYYFSRYIESYQKRDSYSKLPLPNHLPKSFYKLQKTKEYQEFIQKVLDTFGDWGDNHLGNIGVTFINGKRKFMIIDFGIAGFLNTKLGGLLATKLELYYS